MKYYKLIYSEKVQREEFKNEYIEADGSYGNLDDLNKMNEVIDEWMESFGYAWFSEGVIYPENFNNDGESLTVSELVENKPEDWEEVEIKNITL